MNAARLGMGKSFKIFDNFYMNDQCGTHPIYKGKETKWFTIFQNLDFVMKKN